MKISQGGVSGTVTDVRIVMKKAIETLASGLVICHNHPSGNNSPSDSDIRITQKIKEAGALMDIQLLDHLIIPARIITVLLTTGHSKTVFERASHLTCHRTGQAFLLPSVL